MQLPPLIFPIAFCINRKTADPFDLIVHIFCNRMPNMDRSKKKMLQSVIESELKWGNFSSKLFIIINEIFIEPHANRTTKQQKYSNMHRMAILGEIWVDGIFSECNACVCVVCSMYPNRLHDINVKFCFIYLNFHWLEFKTS